VGGEWILTAGGVFSGLLGGAVYVNGYRLASASFPATDRKGREQALTALGAGDSIGITLASLCGILIQACVYRRLDIEGAPLSCPFY